jgi:hypothetical protein
MLMGDALAPGAEEAQFHWSSPPASSLSPCPRPSCPSCLGRLLPSLRLPSVPRLGPVPSGRPGL